MFEAKNSLENCGKEMVLAGNACPCLKSGGG